MHKMILFISKIV